MKLIANCTIQRSCFVFLLFFILIFSSNSWSQQKRVINVATYHYPPVVFQDGDGKYQGVQIEILEEIARIEGWDQ